jgi:phosphoenolpyruvate carboxykinase (diphosphate)
MTSALSSNAEIRHLNLKLAELGLPVYEAAVNPEAAAIMASFIAHSREKDRLLASHLCAPDARIQAFLYDYLGDLVVPPRLPGGTLILDRAGLARTASIPPDRSEYTSDIVASYRLANGVLHNPKSDRRTTAGIFHIAEGGLPIPDDKKAVPRAVFAALLRRALDAPPQLLQLPFTASQERQARCWVSLYLRPLICPEVTGTLAAQRMETRFFVPGTLVSNLDFVETIFGNAGDPNLPENDAALDVEHWSGHTGCVILAPHLVGSVTKKDLGLPAWDQATERQRRDGMCWRDPAELYNDGQAFKICARDATGVILTVIGDNYFGYCKKEVKTQISYAANLFGLAEEEHAGGALVFPRYDLAGEFDSRAHVNDYPQRYADIAASYANELEVRPGGYAVDRRFPTIVCVPETSRFDMESQSITWEGTDGAHSIKLLLDHHYLLPSGFGIHLEKPMGNRAWRLIGTRPDGTLCHKPCTVSGGGKSEISKPITDAIIHGPVFVADFQSDFDAVDALLKRDYSQRFRNPERNAKDTRAILSPERSLGSVIKLLTPSPEDYHDEYNAWLGTIPQHIKELVFVVKRFWKPSWNADWRDQFAVDIVNGESSNELRLGRKKLATQFLRVGYGADGSWRTFGLRKDFHPAVKIQAEDDITASVTLPRTALGADAPEHPATSSFKFVHNCETRLFQRPDDAIVRGYDHMTERDFAQGGNFYSNYEPLPRSMAHDLIEESIGFHQFTRPMQELIESVDADPGRHFFVCPAFPRLVGGKPSKNPRYLQLRPDLADPRSTRLAELAQRFARRLTPERPLHVPVRAILAGRRNNPAEEKVPSLACYGPIHYMELPELFMEFISSMTGKSPSTTGAGSEGAMTKGPFNALLPVYDLNAALVGYIVSGYPCFLTSAGCLGPKVRVDHDISLLVPEVWCRMGEAERDPQRLIEQGLLEPLKDQEFEGRTILASRLGYRITHSFVNRFFGRIFNHPHAVLPDEMLRPELQDPAEFAAAVDNVIATHRHVAAHYFNDGSIEAACPPLRALLHCMRDGHFEGHPPSHPAIRELFQRERVLGSDWYAARLAARQKSDIRLWQRHVAYVEKFLAKPYYADEALRLGLRERLSLSRVMLDRVKRPEHLESLRGTLGAEPALVG